MIERGRRAAPSIEARLLPRLMQCCSCDERRRGLEADGDESLPLPKQEKSDMAIAVVIVCNLVVVGLFSAAAIAFD